MLCSTERRACKRALLAATVAGLLASCASNVPTERSVPAQPAPMQQQPTPNSPALPMEKDRARVEVDGDLGFTVTEVVHIGSDVRSDYQRAIGMLAQERVTEAIALLEDVVERAPGLTAPHVDLGVAYGRGGEWHAAEKSLQAALSLAPNHPAALNELGIVYRRLGKFDAARSSYERALAVHPTYHYALRNLGVLCDLYLDDLPCALEHYHRYSVLVPEDTQVAMWLGDLRTRMGVASQE